MRFSVIITTYNRADIIPVCIDSLLKQNFSKQDFEIIIADNNSTDNTKEVIQKIIRKNPDTKIKYIFIPKNGQVYARQAGILAAENEILTFTDDDGILSENWLAEIEKVFLMNRDAVGVAGKIIIKWDEQPPEWIYDYEVQLGKLDYGEKVKFEVGLYMNAGNLSIKKDVLIKVGGFNPEMVGDWLVGDGETGLWNKLRKGNYLIGWAPDALMEHCQTVKKNATIDDIKRRFMNNGICTPYNIFAVEKKGAGALCKNFFHSIKQSAKWQIKKIKYTMAGNTKSKYYSIFKRAFYDAQISYTLKLLFNKEFRDSLTKEDWVIKSNSTGAVV